LNHLKEILSGFDLVSLEEILKVSLMDRIDERYWFHYSQVAKLLEKAQPYYAVLDIDSKRLMEYKTTYFDTPENKMYLTHHNQKLNRYKIRRRSYLSTNTVFFEVKMKNNQLHTVKERIETQADYPGISKAEHDFLQTNTLFKNESLMPTLNNRFYRISLMHKERKDRCTIDIKARFWNDYGRVWFDDLVILELKYLHKIRSSTMITLLKEMKIRQQGLSKYCMARAILEPRLKQNAFKERLRYLEEVNKNVEWNQ